MLEIRPRAAPGRRSCAALAPVWSSRMLEVDHRSRYSPPGAVPRTRKPPSARLPASARPAAASRAPRPSPIRVPSNRPAFTREQIRWIQRALSRILSSGRLILGPYTSQLEQAFRAYAGSPWAVAVSSCTAALEIALRYFGVEGGEVVVPTNTFVASANAVRFAGGTPVLAD